MGLNKMDSQFLDPIEIIFDLKQVLHYSQSDILRGVINNWRTVVKFDSSVTCDAYTTEKEQVCGWLRDSVFPEIGRLWCGSGVKPIQIEATLCFTSDGNITATANSMLPGLSSNRFENSLTASVEGLDEILKGVCTFEFQSNHWRAVSIDVLLVADADTLVRHSSPICDGMFRLSETSKKERLVQFRPLPFNCASPGNIELKYVATDQTRGCAEHQNIREVKVADNHSFTKRSGSGTTKKTRDAINSIYQRAGKRPPAIFNCDTSLQLIVYPLALALKESGSNIELRPLRKWLKSEFERNFPLELTSFNLSKTLHDELRQIAWSDFLAQDEALLEILPEELDFFTANSITSMKDRVLRNLPPVWISCSALNQWFPKAYRELAIALSSEKGTPVIEPFLKFYDQNSSKKNVPFDSPFFDLYSCLVSEWWGPWDTPFLANQRWSSLDMLTDWSYLYRTCNAAVFFEEVAFICDNPLRFYVNELGQRIDLMKPATLEDIHKERNIERRRALIEQFGLTRFMDEAGYRVIDQDLFGTLIRKEMSGDEPIVMVIVENSTRGDTGESKKYMLRVPPDMCTAKEAVAWTFGLPEHEYCPSVES